MDSLLIGINVERTLRLHTVTKRKTRIFTSAQKTSGFPPYLGICGQQPSSAKIQGHCKIGLNFTIPLTRIIVGKQKTVA